LFKLDSGQRFRATRACGGRLNSPEGTGEGWPDELSTDECERFDLDHENFDGIAVLVAGQELHRKGSFAEEERGAEM
jgi:hypothetical protein